MQPESHHPAKPGLVLYQQSTPSRQVTHGRARQECCRLGRLLRSGCQHNYLIASPRRLETTREEPPPALNMSSVSVREGLVYVTAYHVLARSEEHTSELQSPD